MGLELDSIAARGAEEVTLKLLEEFKIRNPVLHWYSGTLPILISTIEQGNYFSINPAMIISKKGRDIIDKIPKNRILTESDGPYIQFKGNPIKSSDIYNVINYLKDLWKINSEQVEKQISNNFMDIINLIKSDFQKL
jgi:TatD DNase family protein